MLGVWNGYALQAGRSEVGSVPFVRSHRWGSVPEGDSVSPRHGLSTT